MSDPFPSTAASLETEADIGAGGDAKVKRWLTEIDHAEKSLKYKNRPIKGWRAMGQEVIEIYRGESTRQQQRFPIFWANIETMKPGLYQNPPKPDIRRRYTDSRNPDPSGREAAIILERGISYAVDDYDFDDEMQAVVEDFLLPGLGQARLRYKPMHGPEEPEKVFIDREETVTDPISGDETKRFFSDQGEVTDREIKDDPELGLYALGDEMVQPLLWEQVECEHVWWRDFLWSPARSWSKVRWVAFRHLMTRDELKDLCGVEMANKVKLDAKVADVREEEVEVQDLFKRATVWEIWDKKSRKVWVIAVGFKEAPLKVWNDPLGLQDFFPCPKPAIFNRTNDSLVPIPLYLMIQHQVVEINNLSRRIDHLIKQLKVAGLYAGSSVPEIESLIKTSEGKMIPVTDWQKLVSGGGVSGLIEWWPIDKIVETLRSLYLEREGLKQQIFELTGLSDIMRGTTNPQETKGAQVIKTQFGTLRQQSPRGEIERFMRDIYRLKAEIIAEKFDIETIEVMSGVKLPTAEEQAELRQVLQQFQQMAQQGGPDAPRPPKELKAAAELPTWDEVEQVLRDQGVRQFRIDVETETTVEPDASEDKQRRVEFVTAITQFLQVAKELMGDGIMPVRIIKAVLLFGIRGFKVGREIEDAFNEIDEIAQQLEQRPDPKAILEQQKLESTSQRDAQRTQIQAGEAEAKAAAEDRKLDLEEQRLATEQSAETVAAAQREREMDIQEQARETNDA